MKQFEKRHDCSWIQGAYKGHMDNAPLQSRLTQAPWLDPAAWRLPGVQPLEPKDWLIRDDAYGGQMALRDQLIETRRGAVHSMFPDAMEPALECLDLVLATLEADHEFQIARDEVVRPDGVHVLIDRQTPLLTLGRLIQEDVCLMQKGPDGHILTGAILCFPASWTLAEKIGRSLPTIHGPVEQYDTAVGQRVQRMFDAIHPDRPLWRANALLYHDPSLHQPRSEADGPRSEVGARKYLRSERQTLRRLPESKAVVFAIHTYVVPLAKLTNEQIAGLRGVGLYSPDEG